MPSRPAGLDSLQAMPLDTHRARNPSAARSEQPWREHPRLSLQRAARKNARIFGAICSRNLRPLNVP